jgi:hypothetical protein
VFGGVGDVVQLLGGKGGEAFGMLVFGLVCWCLVWYGVGRRPRVKSVYESMSRTCDCGGSQDGKVSQNSLVSQRY